MSRTSYASDALGLALRHRQPEALAKVRAALDGRTSAQAAETLGVPLRTLQHWLDRYPELGRASVDLRRKPQAVETERK